MKTVAILTAAAAIMAATSAYASVPETHDAGGPIKQGKFCWSATNSYGAGFWHRCGDVPRTGRTRGIVVQIPNPPPVYTPPPPVYSTVGGMNDIDGSGDGGGGGGGGGGR
jgi:hypothetical protein